MQPAPAQDTTNNPVQNTVPFVPVVAPSSDSQASYLLLFLLLAVVIFFFTVGIGLPRLEGANAGVQTSNQQNYSTQNQPVPEPSPKMATAYGTIIKIDTKMNMLEIEPLNTGIGHNWQIIADEKTILSTNAEWDRASLRPIGSEGLGSLDPIRNEIKPLLISEFKIGDDVQLLVPPEVDLTNTISIEKPIAILKI